MITILYQQRQGELNTLTVADRAAAERKLDNLAQGYRAFSAYVVPSASFDCWNALYQQAISTDLTDAEGAEYDSFYIGFAVWTPCARTGKKHFKWNVMPRWSLLA